MILVFLVDFPENSLAFVQEGGHAGRWQGASPLTDEYILCGLTWSYYHIVTWLYWKDDTSYTIINEGELSGFQSTQLLSLNEYRRQCTEDFNLLIIGLILQQEYVNCCVTRLTINPCTGTHNLEKNST